MVKQLYPATGKYSIMYSIAENAEKFITAAGNLAETKVELAKLKATAKVSQSLASVLSIIMVIVFGGGAITIVSFGFAYLIGQALDNISYGFFIIGTVYALAGLLVYVKRKEWIQQPLSDLFIDKITGNDD